jgi:hypothetical protein
VQRDAESVNCMAPTRDFNCKIWKERRGKNKELLYIDLEAVCDARSLLRPVSPNHVQYCGQGTAVLPCLVV